MQERTGAGRSAKASRRAGEAVALQAPTAAATTTGDEPSGYRQRLGAIGEQRAAEWYGEAGYEVVARNWRCREGEIDLVAVGRGAVVFCEVKTRTSDRFGVPAEAVTPLKQARLRALAAQFLRDHPQPSQRLRFDVASVRSGKVDVIEGAF
jgi:putative endonuclease